MTCQVSWVPDAVAAVIAAVIEDNPFAPPNRLGVLVVDELRRQKWRVSAPTGRLASPAIDGSSNSPPGPQSVQKGSQGR